MEKIKDQLNRPLRDLRISVMDTCNYRCTYCMPSEIFTDKYQFLRPEERLSFEEIVYVVETFAHFGVNKIRLTGGEPLLRKGLPELISKIKNVKGIDDIAMTTNGQLLDKQLNSLITAGLDRINISLDTLDPQLYHQISGHKGDLSRVLKAIDLAANSSLKSVKINCVLQKGLNENDFIPLLQRFVDTRVVVRFIEFMDVGNKNQWNPAKVVPFSDTLRQIESHWSVMPLQANYSGEVARRYKYKDHQGEIGFITSISKPFCQNCSRARISADGKLYTCLFANDFHDLRPYLRGATEVSLMDKVRAVWRNREDRYSEIRHELEDKNNNKVEMYVIGG